MKFIITGSGGCVSLPRPLCNCKICVEAREKGFPYARCGCSLFLEDISLLIDTPEDICYALNNSKIEEIQYLFYSHKDPDHTFGIRVLEQLRLNWLNVSIGKQCNNPIIVGSLPNILEDIKCMTTKYGGTLDYYQSQNLIKCQTFKSINIKNINISLIPLDDNEDVAIFVFEEDGNKLIYAPCDVKPFPVDPIFKNANYLIIGNSIIGDTLKNGFKLEKGNLLKEGLFSIEEIIEIKNKYNIENVIITHLEEDWGKSYNDYLEIEKEYDNLKFAYDGMMVLI